MDLWGLIAADHANIKELCREVMGAVGSGPDGRDRLFDQLAEELERHLRAEEDVLYPALEADERSRADALMAESEHDEIRARLESLVIAGPRDWREWTHRFESFAHVLERHFRLEELGVLVTARGTLDPEQAGELTRAFEEAKIDAFRPADPAGPSLRGPILVLLVGALAGAATFLAATRSWRSLPLLSAGDQDSSS